MPPFEERELAEETRYAAKKEWAFRAKARRNKLLALWAAGKMGKTGAEARRYAKEFARREFADRDDGKVIAQMRDELLAEGIFVPDDEIRHHVEKFAKTAAQNLMR
jgi:hypothetical protein